MKMEMLFQIYVRGKLYYLFTYKMVCPHINQGENLFISIGKSASAGAGAIIKKWGAVRKCVRNNYLSAGVRAPHSEIPRNPTSDPEPLLFKNSG